MRWLRRLRRVGGAGCDGVCVGTDDMRGETDGLGIAVGQRQSVFPQHTALMVVVLWIVRRAANGGDCDDLPSGAAQKSVRPFAR